ncbi:adhesion G-protein coupled receptor G1-like isoform X2 [Puntigrus tetrazona]|uniref:adhesion G-protein coupled receptor G1-like isoform X2 n=1 Tax=Puntigrus tetrazona TaxID=1606681 RepID=UPI001C8954F0|nr:adhesion G-protein coupled receptor G1-like isoform X2 [Puntigrus tetrazona]
MFWKKPSLLWLMITSCAVCQITCSKIMIIAESLADTSFWSSSSSNCSAINVTCPPANETLIGDFCIVNVKQNTSSSGQCNSYSFSITNDGGKYEVRMNETVKNIQMWFLPNTSQCLPSNALSSEGCRSYNAGLCQSTVTPITNIPSSCPSVTSTCTGTHPDTCCLSITPVDPENKCKNTVYGNSTCRENKENGYILHLNGSEWMCVNCTDETSTTTSSTTSNPTTSSTSPTTTSNPTNISTSPTTTSNPTDISTSRTTTSNPTNISTSPTTTSNPTNISTSPTTTSNPTNISTSPTTTSNPTTSSTSPTTTSNPTNISTSRTTTSNPTNISTSPTTTSNPTNISTSHDKTPEATVPPPEMTIDLSDGQNNTGKPQTNTDNIEPETATENLEKVESLFELMEKSKKTNAAIVIGDVIGVLQRQPKDKPTTDINICYSSSQNMINVVEGNQIGYPWSVKIPGEAFDKSRLENNGSAFVGVLRFINMGNKNKTETHTVLNNESYGITMGANISNLMDNIKMTIKTKNQVLTGNVSCVSWDGKGELIWTTFGCVTEIINNTIKCSCSHLTFFAVLMSLPSKDETAQYLESLTMISSIGCGISIFFISIALFMHFLLRKAKSNQATKILMNMFVSLFLLNASFLSNESVANTQDNAACVFIALLLHYSMLASFTWFFIQALHMYLWLIRQNVTITNYMRKITVLGWACPAPIVVAIASAGGYEALTLNSTSGKVARMCWITNPYIHYIVNIGYYALVFIFTTGIFIMIVTKVVQARNIKVIDGKRKTFRKQLMMVLSLFLLFGLTWSVAFFSYGPMLIPSYYIFTVFNSFQGFFLFLYYYHIHKDITGDFSDDPGNTDSTTTIAQSRVTALENIYN